MCGRYSPWLPTPLVCGYECGSPSRFADVGVDGGSSVANLGISESEYVYFLYSLFLCLDMKASLEEIPVGCYRFLYDNDRTFGYVLGHV